MTTGECIVALVEVLEESRREQASPRKTAEAIIDALGESLVLTPTTVDCSATLKGVAR